MIQCNTNDAYKIFKNNDPNKLNIQILYFVRNYETYYDEIKYEDF